MASPSSISPSPTPNFSRIPRKSFSTAIDALLKWIRAQPKHQKSQLFEPDDVLYLILTRARIPSKGRTNPYRIPIPHPLHPFDPQSTSICLILDDRPSSPLLPPDALDQIRTRNLPVASVIGLSDLKSDYRPYEARRKLCDSYDLFFADRKILPLLPRLLGKHFFKTKKIPLAVDSARPGWAEQIKSWCESSLLYLRTGTCSGLKIGRVTQSKDEIVDNAMAVIQGAMELVPKKWGNLRSVHVKTVESVALPVYQAVPEIGLKIEGIWDEKGGSFVKGKKRVRDDEEKKGKKGKKERIHDAGLLDEGGDGDGEVVSEDMEGENGELEGEIREEGDELMVNEDDDVANEEDAVNSELEENGKKKKKTGKKGGKVKKGKRAADEEDDGEQNGVSESSEKKTKKQKKMEVDAVVASDVTKKSKPKKKKRDDDDVVLTDDEEEEAIDELGMDKGMKKKKLKKGGKGKEGKRGGTEEDAGKENGGSELSGNKKNKLKKDAIVASDGIEKCKLMKSKVVKKRVM